MVSDVPQRQAAEGDKAMTDQATAALAAALEDASAYEDELAETELVGISEAIIAALAAQGWRITPSAPEDVAAFIAEHDQQHRALVRAALEGLRAEVDDDPGCEEQPGHMTKTAVLALIDARLER